MTCQRHNIHNYTSGTVLKKGKNRTNTTPENMKKHNAENAAMVEKGVHKKLKSMAEVKTKKDKTTFNESSSDGGITRTWNHGLLQAKYGC